MNGVKTANEYMRWRLRKFTKYELIDGILALQFSTINSIVHRCEGNRIEKRRKDEEQKEMKSVAEEAELRKCVDRYNALVKKARAQGFASPVSIAEIEEMHSLVEQMTKILKG